MEHKDFAKIVRATDGRQVLYYVEPEGDDYLLHQVVPFDGFQADVKIGFNSADAEKNELTAYAAFDCMAQQQADNVIALVQKMMHGEE